MILIGLHNPLLLGVITHTFLLHFFVFIKFARGSVQFRLKGVIKSFDTFNTNVDIGS
jgi:hypothetical protein